MGQAGDAERLSNVFGELPEDIREAFRIAGLSHALAASGFHLSVLLGSVLLLCCSSVFAFSG